MGEVWLGIHRKRRTPVAVKVLMSEQTRRSEYRYAFGQEVRSVAALDHPGVVQVYDYGEISKTAEEASNGRLLEGSPYLVMEWADQGTLRPLVGKLSWPAIQEILFQLLGALAHSHARGVIHRDIKPSIVLRFGATAQSKLSDFGVAFAHERGAMPYEEGSVVGTPAFMAPEQFDSNWREYGPWTDLYGLGCLAYTLISGSPPFGDVDDVSSIQEAHFVTPVPDFADNILVPDAFMPWLRRLLEKEPERRFRRAADAAYALTQLGTFCVDADQIEVQQEETRFETTSGFITRVVETQPRPKRLHRRRSTSRLRPVIPPVAEKWKSHSSIHDWTRLEGTGLGLHGLRPPRIVGRESEKEALWSALREVSVQGGVGVVVLDGPTGVGKTRLATWLSETGHEEGVSSVLSAVHGFNQGPGDGLAPMVARFIRSFGMNREQVFDRVERTLQSFGIDDPEEIYALVEFALQCAQMGIENDGSPRVRFGSIRERNVLLERFIRRVCWERPVILKLEDVQWGLDTLHFVEHLLASDTAGLSLMLVMTVREDVLVSRPDENEILQRILQDDRAMRIPVAPLSKHDRKTLIDEVLGLEPDLAVAVAERTSGNPLFAVQLVGDWVERRILKSSEEGFVLAEGADVGFPDTLHSVSMGVLERFITERSEDEVRALELAAALGLHVNMEEWTAVCEQAGVKVSPDLLDALLDYPLAVSTPVEQEAGWSFQHALLRASLERHTQEAGRWEEANALCAQVLSEYSGLGYAERIGHHFLEANQVAEALQPLLDGARERSNLGDYPHSLSLLKRRELAMEKAEISPSDSKWGEGWIQRGLVERSLRCEG